LKTILLTLAAAFAIIAVACTQITIFVIQPIGAIPEGKTLILFRTEQTKFIDSADAICEREIGSVNLLCRIRILGAVVTDDNILLRLPYYEWLYEFSTGGKRYSR
tara:strand:+ start:706 stop:1020 length:315 start_codon:yes stop_codon:yes gene_type:complete